MLQLIAIILIGGWLLGLVSSHPPGGFIPVLLLVAIIPILLRIIHGRAPV